MSLIQQLFKNFDFAILDPNLITMLIFRRCHIIWVILNNKAILRRGPLGPHRKLKKQHKFGRKVLKKMFLIKNS